MLTLWIVPNDRERLGCGEGLVTACTGVQDKDGESVRSINTDWQQLAPFV